MVLAEAVARHVATTRTRTVSADSDSDTVTDRLSAPGGTGAARMRDGHGAAAGVGT